MFFVNKILNNMMNKMNKMRKTSKHTNILKLDIKYYFQCFNINEHFYSINELRDIKSSLTTCFNKI